MCYALTQYHLKQWFNIVKAKVAIYFKNFNLGTKPIAIKHTQLIKIRRFSVCPFLHLTKLK
jgi:hypothetical protein